MKQHLFIDYKERDAIIMRSLIMVIMIKRKYLVQIAFINKVVRLKQ